MMYGKIKKIVSTYKDVKLKQIDKLLIKGLFVKRLKDFDEEERERNGNK